MTIYDLALTFVAGLGNRGAARLVDAFGSAEAVFNASEAELRYRAELRTQAIQEILSRVCFREAEREAKYAERHNIVALAATDSDYPELLRHIPDRPHVLYCLGAVEALHRPSVAMVGTRNMSVYGQRMGYKIVEQLRELCPEVSIVSGLALGNDGNAHRAALHYGATTVGVVANSLPDITPAEHHAIAEQIVAKGGAIVSELSSQQRNNGRFFPSRNRIIAALASGVVVVESPYKGGSLLTADMALDYGRVVMAVPGRADDKGSYGSNLLIKHNKAAMVCSGSDIVHELGWDVVQHSDQTLAPEVAHETVNISDQERRVLDAIGQGEAVDYDTVAARCGIPMGQVAAILVSLELCDLVRLLPGKKCERAI